MLVLAGPPGSGKSHRILEALRAELRRGGAEVRLVVPTATMALHVRNQLAREGLPLRPNVIQTLSRFVEPWIQDYPEITPAALELAVDRILASAPPPAFSAVAHLPGFRAAVCELIDEFFSAGCDSQRLEVTLAELPLEAPLAPAFLSVFRAVEREVIERGWTSRASRLRSAAEAIRTRGLGRIRQVQFDGFFKFSAPEVGLLDAIRGHADVTVALPVWDGSAPARAALAAIGFREVLLPAAEWRAAAKILVKAPGIEQEAEEIARRILEQAEGGRLFREMGVVLRGRDPYVPVLQAVFGRYGIPARFLFAEPLAGHALVRYLEGAVEAMRAGWDHAETLAVLKMASSGFGIGNEGDRFDFAVRERLPGSGLDGLRELSDDPQLAALLDRLGRVEAWAASRELPARWAERACTLRSLVPAPAVRDEVDHETAALWRGHAIALEKFDAAMEEAAAALAPDEPASFSEFWEAAKLVLRRTWLRVPDRRRNVVQVMDVEEARQWELPVVFLCGLLEKQFPRYHSGEPVFGDAARMRLRRAGIHLETTAGRRRTEEFLFEIAATRATDELVLSYPESNSRGEPNLPSFFLDGIEAEVARSVPAAPPAGEVERPRHPPGLQDPEIVAAVAARHAVLRPTAIEVFLQCPFQFFLEQTLELKEPPPRPADRLSAQLAGQVVHQALAEMEREGGQLETVFARVFDQLLARARVPRGCRAELARITMLRDLRAWRRAERRLEGWRAFAEQSVRFPLGEEVEISGRIDRFQVSEDGRVVVVDFKYSGAQGIRRRIRGYAEGRCVQGALYLLGLEHRYGYTPAGFFYCGLKGEITVDGWHTGLPGFEDTGTAATPQAFREQLDRARAITLAAAAEIRAGRVEPWPREHERCEFCAYGDLCRLAPAAAARAEAGE